MRSSLLEELGEFPGREEALRQVTRFHIFNPMFYRSNDAIHSRRVHNILRHIMPFVRRRMPNFDESLAEALALVHDDAEIITGDEQAGNKANMTPEQLAEVKRRELAAIEELAERFPKTLGRFNYRELLLDACEKKSIECKTMQFADKFDGLGEALHEIEAGNVTFAMPVTTKYGVVPIAPRFYGDFFRRFASLYPEVGFLTEGSRRLIDLETLATNDWKTRSFHGTLHTRESLLQQTWIQPYELWKKILLSDKDEEEFRNLTTKVE